MPLIVMVFFKITFIYYFYSYVICVLFFSFIFGSLFGYSPLEVKKFAAKIFLSEKNLAATDTIIFIFMGNPLTHLQKSSKTILFTGIGLSIAAIGGVYESNNSIDQVNKGVDLDIKSFEKSHGRVATLAERDHFLSQNIKKVDSLTNGPFKSASKIAESIFSRKK